MIIKEYNKIKQKQVDKVLVRIDVAKRTDLEEALGNLFDYGYDMGFIDKESGAIVRLKNKQAVDAVLCAFLYFYINATESASKLQIIAELHSKLMEVK